MSIFADGEENRNVPISVVLIEPQIWSFEMLDSLADLDYVILWGCKTWALWTVLGQKN